MRLNLEDKVYRIIVKVGTSSLTHSNGKINIEQMEKIVKGISKLSNSGYEVILVSSGAVGAGLGKIVFSKKSISLPKKQAAAAIGQVVLMNMYGKMFKKHGKHIAQILLTRDDLLNRRRNLNARNTLLEILKIENTIPIINENDTVAVEEIKLGDNDNLASLVGVLIDADLVILLSDIDGLYDDNPNTNLNAKLIEEISDINDEVVACAGGSCSEFGTGGMISKIEAGKIAVGSGIYFVIGNASNETILQDILHGDFVGTMFLPKDTNMDKKKKWLLFSSDVKGSIIIDDGAREALLYRGKSLLAIGITEVIGDFKEGDVVSIKDLDNLEIGRGITYYDSNILKKIKGLRKNELRKDFNDVFFYDNVVHRDNLSLNIF